MSDLIVGAFSAADEVGTGIMLLAILVTGAIGILAVASGVGWLVFQFVKTCTRNLVRGGADR